MSMYNRSLQNVRSNEADGFGCGGPIEGGVIAEAEVNTGTEHFFLCLAQNAGVPNFYKTEESTLEKQIKKYIQT